jgi:hypothetical protein
MENGNAAKVLLLLTNRGGLEEWLSEADELAYQGL